METTLLSPWILILVAAAFHPYRGYVDLGTRKRECDVIELSMMNESAAYIYTQSDESDLLAIKYLEKELKNSSVLHHVWEKALELRGNDKRLKMVRLPRGLREEHVLAIIAYTLLRDDYRPSDRLWGAVFMQFNAVLRMYGANNSVYAERFPFKAFHYLLSVAIARLREDQGETPQPIYRRINATSIGKEGDRMKFGQFASSSRNKRQEQFGNKTIFTIYSQYGALIQNYSVNPDQEEVLIPPYEAFKITSYEKRTDGVDISLQTYGEVGIPVRVEMGSNGEMRVLRYEGNSMSLLMWFSILTLLALCLIKYM